jgi:hypothetical protein
VEDVRANGEDARGELCPANLSCVLNERKERIHLRGVLRGAATFSYRLGEN